jgi:arylsulfatase A
MASATALAWTAPQFASSQNTDGKLPNIVIMYADDMGYGDLGVQNPESKIPTPNLDRLAGEGIRFTDAHSSSGVCTPSRYALLTGRYHWRKFHGIVNAFGGSVFDAQRLTLPEMLKEKGYRTACIGKWHLGWAWDAIRKARVNGKKQGANPDDFDWSRPIPDGPLAHGFDHYFGDDVPNFPPYTWIENDRVLIRPTEPYKPNPMPAEGAPEGRSGPMVAGWRQDQVMPRLTEKAVEWIGRQKGRNRPFFLYFPWTSPHAPIVPAREFQGKTKAGAYGDFVFQSDWSAGQVLEALDSNGFRDNTLVIFTSDNGPEKYAYDRIRNSRHRSMGPLRGVKRDIWEGGHRIPFVVRWPGVIEPGRVSGALVRTATISCPCYAANRNRRILAEPLSIIREPITTPFVRTTGC